MTDEILEGNEAQETETENIQADTEADISGIAEDEGSDLQSADADLEPDKKGGVQKKFDKLTRQKHEANEQAAYWKGVAETQAQQAQQAQQVQPVQEDESAQDRYDYDTDEAYIDAQIDKRMAANALAQDQAVKTQIFNDQMAKGREKYENFDSIANSGIIRTQEVLAAVQATGDDMPDVIVALSKKPNNAARLHGLPPVQLGMEIGKIQARLNTKKPGPKPTNAPEPLSQRLKTGGAVTTQDVAKMGIKEQHAKWDADRRAAAGRK